MKKLLLLVFLLTALVQITAQNTYVPDDNFEQALIDLGYDNVLDDYVLTANIIGVTSLDVSDKDISDLTGIEDFASLTLLSCYYNNLTALDVSQNSSLTNLSCYVNQLTSLDVSQNTQLVELNCSWNQLSTLDVTQNIQLAILYCTQNQLSSLDVTQNTQLVDLHSKLNQLTTLDVSQNTGLECLKFSNNQLSTLDITQNTELIRLWCNSNSLSTLDITQNTELVELNCNYNQLVDLDVRNGNNTAITLYNSLNNPNLPCIFVDDAAWSTSNWTNIDPTSKFVETQIDCIIGIDEVILQGFEIYPNPVVDELFINNSNSLNIQSIQLYDVLGRQVILEVYNFQQIDVSSLKSGVYIVKIETDRGTFNKNLIKE